MKKFTAIKNLLTKELADHEIIAINNCYQDEVNGDDYIYSTDDFDEIMNGKTPSEIANMVSFGNYNPLHMWMWFNGYGNIVTSNDPCDCNGYSTISIFCCFTCWVNCFSVIINLIHIFPGAIST